jgi:S1-C subfamily serine protease
MSNEIIYKDFSLSYTPPFEGEISPSRLRRYASTVTVYLEVYQSGQLCGSGTGTVISREGHILTCEVVIDDADRVRAKVYAPGDVGNDYDWFECDILHPALGDLPLALLKIRGSGFQAASLRPADQSIGENEPVLIAGFPDSISFGDSDDRSPALCSTQGHITETVKGMIETVSVDAAGVSGSIGGPVFSMVDGRVIGVFNCEMMAIIHNTVFESNFFYPIGLLLEQLSGDLSKEEVK